MLLNEFSWRRLRLNSYSIEKMIYSIRQSHRGLDVVDVDVAALCVTVFERIVMVNERGFFAPQRRAEYTDSETLLPFIVSPL